MAYDEGRWKQEGLPMAIHCLKCTQKKRDRFIGSHYHEYIELLWGLKGVTSVFVNGEIHNFGEGELMILNSKEPHAMKTDSITSEYVVVKFLPQIIYSAEQSVFELKYLLPFLLSHANHPRVIPAEDPLSRELGALMVQMLEQWTKKEFGYELAIKGTILILFSRLLKNWNEKKLIGNALSEFRPQTLERLTKAMEYADAHVDEADEKKLASVAGFSSAYFSRCFSRLMHMTFATYLTLLRLSKAEKLLATTDLSITRIAQTVGYSTASHFSQQFKKHKNCSPSNFRLLMGRPEVPFAPSGKEVKKQ